MEIVYDLQVEMEKWTRFRQWEVLGRRGLGNDEGVNFTFGKISPILSKVHFGGLRKVAITFYSATI